MNKKKNITRRGFLKTGAGAIVGAAAFPYVVPSSALGKAGTVAPSNRIVMGAIGVGPQGMGVTKQFMQEPDTQIVAVCDVKKPARDNARESIDRYYGAKVCAGYVDFMELLARDDIDAVVIGTQDHWHVLQALAAARAGKDMYVEKPLSISIQQGRVLRKAINDYKRIFQFGTQQRSDRNFRFACELVLNGRIGKVHTIKVGVPGGRYTQNYPAMPVPDWIDYDRWLGPAPWAAFTENRVINQFWWHTSDYTLGFISGWGIHHVDIGQWGNGTQFSGPVEIEGSGVFPTNGLCDCAVTWDVNLTYANGVVMNFTDSTKNKQGVLFEGADGWVYVKRGKIDAHSKSLLSETIGPNEIHLPVSNNHKRNLVDCIKAGTKPVAPIEAAVRSDAICHLSDIAIRLGRKLKWDAEKERFTNDDEANRMLRRPMRSPWHL